MDFFAHQDKARRRTGWLVFYFVAAVVAIVISVYAVIAALIVSQGQGKVGSLSIQSIWLPDLFMAVSAGTLSVIGAGSFYKMAQLAGGGEVVARSLGGRPILPNSPDLSERVLMNVVEEMALAAGTPVPPVFLLDKELGINAFAAGTTPQNAVIGITKGAIQNLKRDELQGVIAHEFSHILNGDMRLNLRLMGLLNGILLIAMIGYFLMRTGSGRFHFASSASNKKGGNPLPLIGLFLYIIGYAGVFFGHLIKSAVSRQREFLADASAVQFTRNPDGIAGALKKIGGLSMGSKLDAANAEEASHLFFGNGLSRSFISLLATHPPLEQRIRRIDPRFDGSFPQTIPVLRSVSELHDPSALVQRLATTQPIDRREDVQEVHDAAVAGAQLLADKPHTAVDQVGAPQAKHIEYASALVQAIPSELRSDVRDPLGAIATIYALLLHREDDAIRAAQWEYLATKVDPRVWSETRRLIPFVETVNAEVKLPLVCMVLPALNELTPQQLQNFRTDVVWLIRADNQLSLFEFAVHRLVLKRLIPRLERKTSHESPRSLTAVMPACRTLFGALAFAAGSDALAASSFELAMKTVTNGATGHELPSKSDCGLKQIDLALDQLAAATPKAKKRILDACSACIGADDHVTVEESELLRIIADALECPMPPLVNMRAQA
jgi:Zn-dependent protease with chaperone function